MEGRAVMRFADPGYLWLLLAIPAFIWLSSRVEGAKRKRLGLFIQPSLWSKVAPELDWSLPRVKFRYWILAMVFFILALARPQWGYVEEKVRTTGMDVLLVADFSQSMMVEDVVPSRLKKAKHWMRTLLGQMEGDRFGIVAFAGSSFVACPLTTDLNYVREVIEILEPSWIQNQGSDLGSALESALRTLSRGSEQIPNAEESRPSAGIEQSAAIVVLTDGEDHELDAIKAAARIKELKIPFFMIGIGTEKGGPVPIRDENGQLRGYKKSQTGEPVVSKLNPSYLEEVAKAGGGRYWNASMSEVEAEQIARDLSGARRSGLIERTERRMQERFQYPLILGIVFLLQEWSVRRRKKVKPGEYKLEAQA